MQPTPTSYSEMKEIASKYYDGHFNDDRSIEKIESLITADCLFTMNIPNEKEILVDVGASYFNEMKTLHFGNVEGTVTKRRENFLQSSIENRLVAKVSNVQKRKGVGLKEENTPGHFKISAKAYIYFRRVEGELKISQVHTKHYKKTRLELV